MHYTVFFYGNLLSDINKLLKAKDASAPSQYKNRLSGMGSHSYVIDRTAATDQVIKHLSSQSSERS